MSPEYKIPTETLTPQERVRINVDPYFASEQCPYEIIFNKEKYQQLLKEAGLSEQEINQIEINFKRTPNNVIIHLLELINGFNSKNEEHMWGLTSPLKKFRINIFPENIYQRMQFLRKLFEVAQKSATSPTKEQMALNARDEESGEKAVKNIDQEPNQQKFLFYLNNPQITKETKRKVVANFFDLYTSKRLDWILLHETKHVIDMKNSLLFFMKRLADAIFVMSPVIATKLIIQYSEISKLDNGEFIEKLITLLGLLINLFYIYKLEPLRKGLIERSADKFADEHFENFDILRMELKNSFPSRMNLPTSTD
jgi:hypothetical protein